MSCISAVTKFKKKNQEDSLMKTVFQLLKNGHIHCLNFYLSIGPLWYNVVGYPLHEILRNLVQCHELSERLIIFKADLVWEKRWLRNEKKECEHGKIYKNLVYK